MQNGKPTILTLSDDMRMNSGVATMQRELSLGTVKWFNWVQIAGAISHPDKGKIINMDAAAAQFSGVPDAKVVLYPVDGYGNEELLFSIIDREKPDAVMHFTDPRFWGWLYSVERQIRSKMPLCYLNIWDSIPYPMYNHAYYESCDLLMSISRQTMNINKWVLGPKKCFVVDGELDENGQVELTPELLTNVAREVSQALSEMKDLEPDRKVETTSDPRISITKNRVAKLFAHKLTGVAHKGEVLTYQSIIDRFNEPGFWNTTDNAIEIALKENSQYLSSRMMEFVNTELSKNISMPIARSVDRE